MNLYEFFPIRVLVEAASAVVTRLSELLAPLLGAQSAAIAIILLTVAVRVLLIPVGRSQIKAGLVRQRLAPELARLRQRYRNDPEQLRRRTMELYAAERASPMAGCLPVLAQAPVLMAVYGLFVLPEIGGAANGLLAHTFLGVPLDAGLLGMVGAGTISGGAALVFAAVMLVIAVVAQASRRLLPMPQPEPPQPGMPDMSGMLRAMSFMPFLTAVFAAFVPLAAGLYLATTTAWTLGERLVLTRIFRSR
ncbi:YidC/Oxa1 family membrane protein insertase [Leucobacter allii]|uniref:Membrane protein insertase YidC n=1 Tax=Leucobacter allii TaxID=2932247 RepID=A0ABY4FL65_9MICO|nr:YidC/Oxa1 family membrane protein insertase [Leucobacter allii]UOQ57011.1 YidC/Oxa1 family membrane protein insertase [Leucobacter allii]UOR01483.1 YidC/Oxa1 family membrane protein insertase [Leucobacter allii]